MSLVGSFLELSRRGDHSADLEWRLTIAEAEERFGRSVWLRSPDVSFAEWGWHFNLARVDSTLRLYLFRSRDSSPAPLVRFRVGARTGDEGPEEEIGRGTTDVYLQHWCPLPSELQSRWERSSAPSPDTVLSISLRLRTGPETEDEMKSLAGREEAAPSLVAAAENLTKADLEDPETGGASGRAASRQQETTREESADEETTRNDFDRPLTVQNIHDEKPSSDRGEQGSSSLSSNRDSLSRDFEKLLADGVFSDVILKCGDRTIAAHKNILAARSPVFSAMLQSRMTESETGDLDIADVDVRILEMFLKYVYSGRLTDVPDELLPGLYAVGDRYAVSPLKTACSERLISNLTRENCLSVLILADAHSDQDLKKAVLDFILNHVEILKNQEWTEFSKENPYLSNEVFQFVFERKLF